MSGEEKKPRSRDEWGRFVREQDSAAARRPPVVREKDGLPSQLRRYAEESPARLRAIADDPDTQAKLKADIERFFFEAVYGKTPAADRESKAAAPQTIRFEGVLDEWSK